ncbi:MAG: DUF3726 domain-containing protein [Hyphomicrobiales bacterium]
MIVSLNEIETTILKAARGAGMEWGLAEEAAQAARWLARLALPWAAPFAALLATGAWRVRPSIDGARLRPQSADAWLCPIRAGAYLSDLGETLPVIVERVLFPVLLLPFAARRASALELAWDGVTVRLEGETAAVANADAQALDSVRADEVTLTAPTGHRPMEVLPPARQGGAEVDAASWAKLRGFEALTYVPASVKSRLSGAGAALDDND